MKIIGIVGGIASGKSLVAAELRRLGAGQLDADRAGHAVLDQPQIRATLVARWGKDVLGSDGKIDRSAVAKIVFAPTPDSLTERRFLENLTHPRIRQRLEEETATMAAQGAQAAVLDAPLLIEAGWISLCDYLIFVDAPRSVRQQRAATRGWSSSEFLAREATQASIHEKRTAADAVVDNGGTIPDIRAQLERLWQLWIGNDNTPGPGGDASTGSNPSDPAWG
ncbi:MAG: dephospho-CoA kinase [Pirellulales bacterium]|nr:dephospho-CoA kinase [Pirellulales bacterium]